MWHPTICFTNLTLPEVTSGTTIYYNDRLSIWLWQMSSIMPVAVKDKWCMRANGSFPLLPTFNGNALSSIYSKGQYQGNMVYYGSNGTYNFYFYNESGIWYASSIVAGAKEEFTYDDDPSTYLGDNWYTASKMSAGNWTGRGLLHGTTAALAWPTFVGWVHVTASGTAPYGAYAATGGATGTKYFGILNLTDDLGNTYTQSQATKTVFNTSVTGYSTMASSKVDDRGDITKQTISGTDYWCIGTYSTSAGTGYWLGPTILPMTVGDTATFVRVWNAGTSPDPYPSNIIVSFSSWAAPATSWKIDGMTLEVGVCMTGV